MNKCYLLPTIALGNLILCYPLVAMGATYIVRDTIPFTDVTWDRILEVPQYNPAIYGGATLTGIEVRVTSEARDGIYTLINTGNSILRYGVRSDEVGVDLSVKANSLNPLPNLQLQPVPLRNIGPGTLAPPPTGLPCPPIQNPSASCRLETQIFGTDSESTFIDPANFGLFTGTGMFSFDAVADLLINVSRSGSSSDFLRVEANAELEVIYTFDDSSSSTVDEPYLGLFSMVALILGSFIIKTRQL